jgi:predicted secreted protein
MALSTGLAIYFLIWWLVLFAVLPWGVQAQGEGAPAGSDPGAPALPRLAAKLLWTTIVSGAIFVVLAYVYVGGLVTLDDLARLMGMSFEHR